jgi:branched-chain amino acid transport system permease protein
MLVATLISPYWDSIATTAGITAIIALGLYVTNSAGALSVAQAALAGMGAYMGAVLTTNFGWPFPAAIVAGCIVAGVGGVFLAVVTLRMNPLVAGLTTLAFGETMVVVAYNISYIGAANSFYGIPPYTTLGGVYITLAVAIFLTWRFEHSRLGLAARACRDDRVAADASGINVPWVKIVVFTLGAALAGVGGVLNAHYIQVVRPSDMSFQNSLPILIVWVFGGSYYFLGPVVGAIVLTFLPELLRFSDQERYMLYGIILTIVIILRPQGLITRVPLGAGSRILEDKRRFLRAIMGGRSGSSNGVVDRDQEPSVTVSEEEPVEVSRGRGAT